MSSDSNSDPADSSAGFADNWAYLKTELNWLDRVLMLSVARHRQDKRAVDRVAQNRADRVSSHWWKGVVSLDGSPAYDEHRKVSKPSSSSQTGGYQKQLERRILASQEQGIVLALPSLRDRLQLSAFEKNMLLMGLAPEVNRRFARMYHFLQGQSDDELSDLPTVELVLRLLCRNDSEWRKARHQVTQESPLVQRGLVFLIQQPYDTLLTTSIKLSEPLLSFLLSEQPSLDELDGLLDSAPPNPWNSSPEEWQDTWRSPSLILPEFSTTVPAMADVPSGGADPSTPPDANGMPPRSLSSLSSRESPCRQPQEPHDGEIIHCEEQPPVSWAELIVPEAIAQDLNYWAQRVDLLGQPDAAYGQPPGTHTLLTGAVGTGKTTAARAIAHHLNCDLYWIDLTWVLPGHMAQIRQRLDAIHPLVLLVKHASRWLSPCSEASLLPAQLRQLWQHRCQSPGITLWSDIEPQRIGMEWIQEMDFQLHLPLPSRGDRQRLWERAIARLPEPLHSKRGLSSKTLSQIELSGGEIERIIGDGAIAAAARNGKLNLDDIQTALLRRGMHRASRQLAQHRRKS